MTNIQSGIFHNRKSHPQITQIGQIFIPYLRNLVNLRMDIGLFSKTPKNQILIILNAIIFPP